VCQRVTAHNTRPLGALGHGGPAHFGSSAAACPLSRHAGWAGRGGSTRPPPASPSPTREALPPGRSGDHAPFFSRGLRIRAGEPGFSPLPMGPQALQRPADRFITHTPLRHALLMAHLSGQSERPHARGLAIGTWRLRQDRLETLAVGSVQGRCAALGPRRLLRHASQPLGMKGLDDSAHGLHDATHHRGNGLRGPATRTREDNLRPAYTKRMRATALGFPLRTLLLGQGANLYRSFHGLIVTANPLLHKYFCGNALGRPFFQRKGRDAKRRGEDLAVVKAWFNFETLNF
jgi:hypothetical protein